MNEKISIGDNIYSYNKHFYIYDVISFIDGKYAYGKKGGKYNLKPVVKNGLITIRQYKSQYQYGGIYYLYNDILQKNLEKTEMRDTIIANLKKNSTMFMDYETLKNICNLSERVYAVRNNEHI